MYVCLLSLLCSYYCQYFYTEIVPNFHLRFETKISRLKIVDSNAMLTSLYYLRLEKLTFRTDIYIIMYRKAEHFA